MSDSPKILTRPLIKRQVYELWHHLRKQGIEQNGAFAIFQPKTSIFVAPFAVPRAFRDTVFLSSVDILLINKPPRGVPFACVDVFDKHPPRDADQKRELFSSIGLAYVRVAYSKIRDCGPEFVSQLLDTTPDIDKLQPVIYVGQWRALGDLASRVEQHRLSLLHEVSLDAVISVRDLEGNLAKRFDAKFLRKTSFDAVIATEPPNAMPLIALEVDGDSHSDENQQKKDTKKVEACRLARLPLIRISWEDIDKNIANAEVVSLPARQKQIQHDLLIRLLNYLAKTLSEKTIASQFYAEQLHHFLLHEAQALRADNPLAASNIEDYARELWLHRQETTYTQNQMDSLSAEVDRWMPNDNGAYYEFHLSAASDDLKHNFIRAVTSRYDSEKEGVFDWHFFDDSIDSRRKIAARVSSGRILQLGGFKFERVFKRAELQITVEADNWEIGETAIGDFIRWDLILLATDALESYQDDIVQAWDRGLAINRCQLKAADWSKALKRDQSSMAELMQEEFSRVLTWRDVDWPLEARIELLREGKSVPKEDKSVDQLVADYEKVREFLEQVITKHFSWPQIGTKKLMMHLAEAHRLAVAKARSGNPLKFRAKRR